MNEIKQRVDQHFAQILEDRRYLHMHPELSTQEKETSEYIARQLREMGLEPIMNVGGYGVTAVIKGSADGLCVGLRADIDAIPVQEKNDWEYCSVVDHVSHACGHDCHTAMLLGVARVLVEMRDKFKGSVKLLFQPSEDNNPNGGAIRMIEDGALENPHVDAVIGQHMWPQLPTGQMGVRRDAMMAASDRFYITINGKGGHGAVPESTVDAIPIAAQVISALQTIVSRNVSPKDSAVVTIGNIHGEGRYNVICGKVTMEGTCRCYTAELQDLLSRRIGEIASGIAEGMGGSCEYQYQKGYPPTINDAAMAEITHAAADEIRPGSAVWAASPGTTGEDFSFFCNAVPSVYYWLGCRDANIPYSETPPLHSEYFFPQEEALRYGAEFMTAAAIKYLNQ